MLCKAPAVQLWWHWAKLEDTSTSLADSSEMSDRGFKVHI